METHVGLKTRLANLATNGMKSIKIRGVGCLLHELWIVPDLKKATLAVAFFNSGQSGKNDSTTDANRKANTQIEYV